MMIHITEATQQFFAPISSSRRTGGRMTLVASALAICLISVVVPAYAASINYGSFPGATVMYTDVTESSVTDPVPLFGAPVVSGDSIDFTPVNFAASSQLHVP